MTDEELIARLRSQIGDDVQRVYDPEALFRISADRIEALVKGYNEALNQLDSARYSVEVLEKRVAHFMARAERLEAALARIEEYAIAGAGNGFEDCGMCENTLDTIAEIKRDGHD